MKGNANVACEICAGGFLWTVQGVMSSRSAATCAIHSLKGSALREGMDCISRKSCCASAISVKRIFSSVASIFKP